MNAIGASSSSRPSLHAPQVSPPDHSSAVSSKNSAGPIGSLGLKASPASAPPRLGLKEFNSLRQEKPAAATPWNPCEGNPDFEKVNSGDPAKGAVAFLPQLHTTPNLTWQSNPALCKRVLASQMEILQQLQKYGAEHVIDEEMTAEESEVLNNLHHHLDEVTATGHTMRQVASGMAAVIREMDKAKDVDEVMSKIHPDWLLQFMRLGAPTARLMARQMTDPSSSLTVHSALPPHLQATVEHYVAEVNRDPAMLNDPKVRRVVFDQREQVVALMAPKVIENNKGGTVFLAYGAGHDFKQAFAGADAPALYRFKSPVAAAFQAQRSGSGRKGPARP